MPNKPIPKPEQFLKILDTLNTQGAANMIDPQSYADMVGQYAFKAYKNDELSYRDYLGIVKPLFGRAGEIVTQKIEERNKELEKYATGGRVKYSNGSDDPDLEKLRDKIIDLMDNENLTFEEAYREAREEGYAVGGRVGFDEGTPKKKGGNYNPEGKNQFTGKMKSIEQIKSIIDSQPRNWTAKDFRGEGKLNKPELGKDFKGKLLTRDDLIRAAKEGVTPYTTGKRRFIKDDPSAKERQKFITAHQGSEMSSPKTSNYNVSHLFPKVVGTGDVTSKSLMIEDKSINREKEGFDKKIKNITKEQVRLVNEKPKNWKYLLTQQNFLAAKTAKLFNQELGNKVKGTLGYFTVNPDTLKFTPKGVDLSKTIGGIYGEPTQYKTMTNPERKNIGVKQTIVQSLIDKVKSNFPDVKTTRASNVSLPQKTLTANMFKSAFKGAGGGSKDQIKDPLGGPDLIDIKKSDKNPYNDY